MVHTVRNHSNPYATDSPNLRPDNLHEGFDNLAGCCFILITILIRLGACCDEEDNHRDSNCL